MAINVNTGFDPVDLAAAGRYIRVPIETDPQALLDQMYTYIQDRVPGWAPADGNLDVWIMQALADVAADLTLYASDVPDDIFRYFGEYIVGVQMKLATYSTFTAAWTAEDALGHTIPAGTQVAVRRPDGELEGFATVVDADIPIGSTVANNVLATAIEPGASADALSIEAGQITVIDALPWVVSIVGVGTTQGGSDGETEEEYMDRLVAEIRLMSPRPILPVDFGVMAQKVEGVDRAWPVNLWSLPLGTGNHEKCITVTVANANGDPVSGAVLTDVDTYLQSLREVNFLVYVTNPTYQNVNVTYAVTSYPNRSAAEVQAEVEAAVRAYISPKDWGSVRIASTDVPAVYRQQNVVRYNDVIAVIDNVLSVDFITDLKLNGAAADVTLTFAGAGTSPVVLPKIGTISGVATVPPA
jgi:hypothetical protein